MLAFITAPAGIPTYQLLSDELASSIRLLGVMTVLSEGTLTTQKDLESQGFSPTDSLCEAVDARVATIAESDFLVAILDGDDPDVLVDIGLAYARETDCYGLQVYGGIPEGMHLSMLDGLLHNIPDLLAHLRRHLRLEPPPDDVRLVSTSDGATG